MSIKLTLPQATLLQELNKAAGKGVNKSLNYTPACMLVSDGFATWRHKFQNRVGLLVITDRGRRFVTGEL